MAFSHFFVARPIFATVLSLLLVIAGAVAFGRLPVAQYPEIAPPTVVVTAAYPGASAEVAADTVATVIEQEINGVENMLYMSSNSTGDGRVTITVTFRLGVDLDAAQVLVQNRVAIAEPRLPEEVRRIGITTRKNSPDFLMVVHLFSPDRSRDQLYISNYATLQMRDALARLDGVGDVRIFGARDYSMRIWLDPDRLAAFNLTASDVVAALRQQNVQVAAGTLNQQPATGGGAFEINVQALGRLIEPGQFADVIVKANPETGANTRLREVARVELGAADYSTNAYLSRDPAVALGFFMAPGKNALATAERVQETLAGLAANFPSGIQYNITWNPTAFIQDSVDEVIKTIFEAVLLVVIVVFVFLQSFRAALIPVLAIPVALVGTFLVMALLGFSINSLTLFGLVLAIGIVVDDAIIVVENVERQLANGLDPRAAAHKTMDEVGGALVAIALVLCAVFIPTAAVPGITGAFYQQFALTIAVSTVISCLVSLTLSPALAGLLLRAHIDGAKPQGWASRLLGRFFGGFNRGFDRMAGGYGRLLTGLSRRLAIVLVVFAGLLAITGWRMTATPTGFIPAQDQAYLIAAVQMPAGAALERTDAAVLKVTDALLDIPGVVNTAGFAGFNGATFTNAPNAGAIFVILDDFAKRGSLNEIAAEARRRMAAIPEAFVLIIPPPAVRGIGTGGGFKMMIEDRTGRGLPALAAVAGDMMQAANSTPGLGFTFSLFENNTPQVYADVDRTKALSLGVPVNSVFDTLSIYLGSAYVNDFNYLGRTYRVTAQADMPFRLTVDDIGNLRTRNNAGQMVPIGAVAQFENRASSYRVPRYNLYPAAEIQGEPAPGVSSGQAIAIMEGLAAERLPQGIFYEWTELAFQQKEAGSAVAIFALSVLFVFLILAAQYESWTLPFSIILIVPMCILAALLGINLRGMDNNILTQIGFVVLIGLACKNAILIVEFAKQLEDSGVERREAASRAASLRLRPILMTSLAFTLGVVPLVIASGAGFEMRQALGTAVFFGMIGVTVAGLFLTPVFYIVCRGLADRFQRHTPDATGEHQTAPHPVVEDGQ
jgi:HAE1 family hydrophobic/amphiphilic exporter-1